METVFFYKDHRIKIHLNSLEITSLKDEEDIYVTREIEIPPDHFKVVPFSDHLKLVSLFNIVTVNSLIPFEYEIEDHEFTYFESAVNYYDHLILKYGSTVVDNTLDNQVIAEINDYGFMATHKNQLIISDCIDQVPVITFYEREVNEETNEISYNQVDRIELEAWIGYKFGYAMKRLDNSYVLECVVDPSITPRRKIAIWNPESPKELTVENSSFNFCNQVIAYSSNAIVYRGEDDVLYSISKPKDEKTEPKPKVITSLSKVQLLVTFLNPNGSGISLCMTDTAMMLVDRLCTPEVLSAPVNYQLLAQFSTDYDYNMLALNSNFIIINLKDHIDDETVIGHCYLINVGDDSTLTVNKMDTKHFIYDTMEYNSGTAYILACSLDNDSVCWIARWSIDDPSSIEWKEIGQTGASQVLVAATEETVITKNYDGVYTYHQFFPEYDQRVITNEGIEDLIQEHPQQDHFRKAEDVSAYWKSYYLLTKAEDLPFFNKTHHLDFPSIIGTVYDGVFRYYDEGASCEISCPSLADDPNFDAIKCEVNI